MAREFVTMDELMMALRQAGIAELDEVKAAYMESDGRISAIPHDGQRRPRTPDPKQV
jgi:uncharacterized membrane protein YcaP (DUF421 family)